MFLFTYEYQHPVDSLSGPGYRWKTRPFTSASLGTLRRPQRRQHEVRQAAAARCSSRKGA